jgi:heterodisulfide reductase subunit D
MESLFKCSACGQCHVVCPVRINTHEFWEQARLALAGAGIPQPEKQLLQSQTIKDFNNSFAKPQKERGLWAQKAWDAGLLLAPVSTWRERPSQALYFAGCTASYDAAMQPVAVQSARLLQEAGVEFSILGQEEPCCVGKLKRIGDIAFESEAKKRMDLFNSLGIRTIVVSCAGCYKGLHSDYSRLGGASFEVLHLTQFLDHLIKDGRLKSSFDVPLKITYHDPCHLGRHNQIYEEPRNILRSIPGLELVEMRRHGAFSSCCGMGGGIKVAYADVQHEMSARRIMEAVGTGAQAVVTPCQTCCLGLLSGTKDSLASIEVHHLNEMLVRSVCPEVTWSVVLDALKT